MWKTKTLELAARMVPMLQKYRYVFLILLAGLIMLCVGAPRDEPVAAEQEQGVQTMDFNIAAFQNDLQEKLSLIEGAGQVQLLLSLEGTEETVYASNTRQTNTGENNASYENSLTVLSDGSYGEQPVRVKSICPTFRGAVVLCEGGDQTTVRLAVTEAVSTACGLGADKISVLKMQNASSEEERT